MEHFNYEVIIGFKCCFTKHFFNFIDSIVRCTFYDQCLQVKVKYDYQWLKLTSVVLNQNLEFQAKIPFYIINKDNY